VEVEENTTVVPLLLKLVALALPSLMEL
jgi:hypothetical protein